MIKARKTIWAGILGIFILLGIYWGLRVDMDSVAPAYGPPHQQAHDELYDQVPQDVNLPPPGQKLDSNGGVHAPALFPLRTLSSRAGFNAPTNAALEKWARRLGAGWYIDWTVQPRFAFQKPEHWQMIRLSRDGFFPSAEAITWLASHYPENVWIIGNEPDNIWQDNLPPEDYARKYHDLYSLIKKTDPSALVAVAGVTQATPLRFEYLDRVLAAYEALYEQPLPVDWWTVHGFVLREERGSWGAEIPAGFPEVESGKLYEVSDVGDVEIFKQQIIAFRTWMAAHGYQDTPLAITEFGILLSEIHGYPPATVARYLADAFTWLDQARNQQIGYTGDDYRLVQRWAWFSLYDKVYYGSNLGHPGEDALTDIGWAFRNFVGERIP